MIFGVCFVLYLIKLSAGKENILPEYVLQTSHIEEPF